MHMGFGLHQEQVQKLVLTPELRQAITILQYSAQDLVSFLENEMQSNPIVEWDEAGLDFETEKWDWSEIAKLQGNTKGEYVRYRSEEQRNWTEQQSRIGISLSEHLLEQLLLVSCDTNIRKVATYIIYSLDENGYLKLDAAEIAALCGVSTEQVEQAIELVQSFEPTGVGARTLQECLLLQLYQKKGIDMETMNLLEVFISNHLQDLADGKWSRIAQALQVSPQTVQTLADLIKTLDPKPGRWYSNVRPMYVIPDVTVERVSGQYVVIVNDRLVPHIRINDTYRKLINSDTQEAKEFVTKKLTSALSLIKSLEQRRQTMYKVTTAIVEYQRDFFDYGITHLKPLTMKQVAEQVGLHESTVSRAVNDKYVQTPRGIFELKFFFSSGVSRWDGEGASSAESIKAQIRKLIASENPLKPYSDQKLADLLERNGVRISRRTVTKYREEIGIPSTNQRKRII
jgi:RNA polymerase sigma-54 factor